MTAKNTTNIETLVDVIIDDMTDANMEACVSRYLTLHFKQGTQEDFEKAWNVFCVGDGTLETQMKSIMDHEFANQEAC